MRTIRIITLAAALLVAAAGIWLLLQDDASIVRAVASLTGYDKPDKIESQLTPARLKGLRAMPVLALLLLAAIAWKPGPLHQVLLRLRGALRFGSLAVRDGWRSLAGWERIALASVMLACTAINALRMVREPAMVDEAMTWLLFTSRGPLVSATYYAAPNNHILHSLLTNATAWIPGDPLVAMRVPALLSGVLAMLLLFLLLRRVSGPGAAFLSWALALGSFPLLYYGYLSRGYMLVVLFSIIALGCATAILRGAGGDARALLALACTAGLYTMPSFLYPTAILLGWLFLMGDTGARWAMVRTGCATAVLAGILYAPGIAMSGLAAFTSNQWVRPIDRSEVIAGWWTHFESTFNWMTGLPFAFPFVLALALACWFLAARPRQEARLAAALVIASLALPVVHSVIPFERTWIYLVPALAMLLAILLGRLGAMLRPSIAIAAGVCALAFGNWRFEQRIEEVEYLAYSARRMYAAVAPVEPKEIYCEFTVMGDHLLFDLRKRGMAYTYALSHEGAERAQHLANPRYALVIVRHAAPWSHPDYIELYADEHQRVYALRSAISAP